MIDGKSLFAGATRAAHRAFREHLDIATNWEPRQLVVSDVIDRSATVEYDLPGHRFRVTFEDISVAPGVSRAGDSPVEAPA